MKKAIIQVKKESIKGVEVFEDIEENGFLIESINWGSNTHLFNKIGSFLILGLHFLAQQQQKEL